MYEVTVEGSFTAAHAHAPGHGPGGAGRDGGAPLHGHDFLVRVRLAGPALVDDVLLDFHEVEVALARRLAELGHRDLSRHPDFEERGATPAALARWLYERLAPEVERPGARVVAVEVHDTERSGARYAPGRASPLA